MLENIAWQHFMRTGDIEAFIEYKKIEKINNENRNVNINETYQGEGNSNKGSNI